jgi:hypothetical protein
MTFRALVMLAAVLLAGCGEAGPKTQPTPAPPADVKKSPLPPEVEFDPATATEKYQKNKKPKP